MIYGFPGAAPSCDLGGHWLPSDPRVVLEFGIRYFTLAWNRRLIPLKTFSLTLAITVGVARMVGASLSVAVEGCATHSSYRQLAGVQQLHVQGIQAVGEAASLTVLPRSTGSL